MTTGNAHVLHSMLVCLMLCCGSAAAAQDRQGYEELLQRCSESIASDVVGIAEIEAECPGIEHAIVELGYAAFISAEQLETLTVRGLQDLQQLVQRYEERADASGALRTDTLDAILMQLQDGQPEQTSGWYDRFKKWLRGLLQQAGDDPDSWLSRWLADAEMSDAMRRVLFYSVVVLVLLLALVVVGNELRAAGFLRRRGRRKRLHSADTAIPAIDPQTTGLSDLEQLPLREQPSLLLRLLAAQLVKRGRLRVERNLTHRELARAAEFDQAAQRERFGSLASLAERLRYGVGPVPDEHIQEIVSEGRSLTSELDADARSAM